MNIVKTNCNVRKDCKYRDSAICNNCTRNYAIKHDCFEQDQEIVKSRFSEIIKNRFNKVQ